MPPNTLHSGSAPWSWPGLFSAVIDSGNLLVIGERFAGGEDFATSTVFDAATGSWTPSEPVVGAAPHYNVIAATQLSDGRVFAITNCWPNRGQGKAAIYGPFGWSAAAAPPFCADEDGGGLTTLPSGRALLARARRAAIYDPSNDRWTNAPPYRFPHVNLYDPCWVQAAPVPGGALIIGHGLNRFTAAERFFEQ